MNWEPTLRVISLRPHARSDLDEGYDLSLSFFFFFAAYILLSFRSGHAGCDFVYTFLQLLLSTLI